MGRGRRGILGVGSTRGHFNGRGVYRDVTMGMGDGEGTARDPRSRKNERAFQWTGRRRGIGRTRSESLQRTKDGGFGAVSMRVGGGMARRGVSRISERALQWRGAGFCNVNGC